MDDQEGIWLRLRETTGLSQREVERQLGWKRGHLSLIERGLPPKAEQGRQLRAFYFGTDNVSRVPDIVA